MVNNSAITDLDLVFGALSDSTRRAILDRLSRGESSVTELAEPFDMSLPAITKHLNVLERAGLLKRTREGRVKRCTLEAEPLSEASAWIERYRAYWEAQLDSLASYLENIERQEGEER